MLNKATCKLSIHVVWLAQRTRFSTTDNKAHPMGLLTETN